jgi:branched-chain amino acid transport system ATP-binding protein
MLEINDLKVCYGNAIALEKISMTVSSKQLTAIIGPNGAGKTTLFKAISRLINPVEGSIIFNGKSILSNKAHTLAKMGIAHCPEGRKTFYGMSVRDNLILGGYILPKHLVEKQLNIIFDFFPILRERKHQDCKTLSGGEQQMLAIGRAFMLSPLMLLIDEPTLGLSPLLVEELGKIILNIKQSGVSVLMAEGDVDLIRDLADFIYVLDHGSLVYSGTVSEILSNVNLSKTYFGI